MITLTTKITVVHAQKTILFQNVLISSNLVMVFLQLHFEMNGQWTTQLVYLSHSTKNITKCSYFWKGRIVWCSISVNTFLLPDVFFFSGNFSFVCTWMQFCSINGRKWHELRMLSGILTHYMYIIRTQELPSSLWALQGKYKTIRYQFLFSEIEIQTGFLYYKISHQSDPTKIMRTSRYSPQF